MLNEKAAPGGQPEGGSEHQHNDQNDYTPPGMPDWLSSSALPEPLPAVAYVEQGWSLVPVARGTKGPLHHGWNLRENCVTDPTVAAGLRSNVGLAHAYSGTMALDIDNIECARTMLAAVGIDLDALLNDPDAVQILSGRHGHAKLLYAMPFGLALPTKKITAGRLTAYELRCGTQDGMTVQDVLPPSIHPQTMQPYSWGGRGHWKRLPTIPAALLAHWQSLLAPPTPPPGGPRPHDGGNDIDWPTIESALEKCDPNCGRREWTDVGMALQWAGARSNNDLYAFRLWDDFSSKGTRLTEDGKPVYPGERHVEQQWRSFKSDKANGITIGTLYKLAQERGWPHPQPDVSPLFSPVPEPSTPLRFEILSAEGICDLPPIGWRIKSLLPKIGVAAIFGPSGSGKSFLALVLAMCIARGERFFGHRVATCPVLYVCLEGEAGTSVRLKAYKQKFGSVGDVRFLISPFNLLEADDVRGLIDAIGANVGVVIIDTLNRAAPGMDENSSVDMGKAIQGAKQLQAAIRGLVLLVHHTGKDSTRGLRGHSSLFAALDAAIETTRTGTQRAWSLAKAKDGEDGQAHGFRLEQIDLGTDPEGEPITSCVVVPVDAVQSDVKPLTPAQQHGLDSFLAAAGSDPSAGVHVETWRAAFYQMATADSPEAKRKGFNRMRQVLVERGRLRVKDDIYEFIGFRPLPHFRAGHGT